MRPGTILPIPKGYIRDVLEIAGVAQATEQPRSEDVISRPGGKYFLGVFGVGELLYNIPI